MTKFGYDFFQENGYDPTLLFLSDDPRDNTSWRRLKFSAGISEGVYLGMKSIRVGVRHSFIEYGHYRFNLDLWKRALEGFDLYFAIGGAATSALPLALIDKPFALWVATPLLEDLMPRMEDTWWLVRWWRRYQLARLLKDEVFILSKARMILALSEYTRQKLVSRCPEIAEKVIVASFPIDVGEFWDTKLPKDGQSPYILSAGRFSDARKNVELLLRAFAIVRKIQPDVQLWLAGEPPIGEKRRLAEQLGLDNSVKYLGSLERKELVPLYQGAHVFALSSWQEGLGIVVLEAMACGIPVVSTRCGGPESIIRDGEDGYLVPLNDMESLAEKLITLLRDDELRAKMGRNARARVEEKFSKEVVSKDFLGCLEQLRLGERSYDTS